MGSLATGKISEPAGMKEALQAVLNSAPVRCGVLKILSKDVTGRIAIVNGRIISGAHIPATNARSYTAIRDLLLVNKGMFAYFEPEQPAEFNEINDGLEIAIMELSPADPARSLEVLASQRGYLCPPANVPAMATPDSFLGKLVNSAGDVARKTMTGIKRLSSVQQPTAAPPGDGPAAPFPSVAAAAPPMPTAMLPPAPSTVPPMQPNQNFSPATTGGAMPPPPIPAPAPIPPPPGVVSSPTSGQPFAAQPIAGAGHAVPPAPYPPAPQPLPNHAFPAAPQQTAPQPFPPSPQQLPPAQPQLATPPVPSAPPSPELPPGLSYPLPPPPPPRASSADNPVITGRHEQQPMPSDKPNTQAYPKGHPLAAKPQPDDNFLKRTAQKLVSRIKMAQMQQDAEALAREEELRKTQIERAAERLKAQERITESQRLRCVELEALSETHGEITLRKRVDWRKDKATLMGALVTAVVLAGVILCMVLSAATSPDKHLQAGEQYLKENKLDRAIAELTLILGPQPSHAKALALRADAYQQNNQWKEAIADYEKLEQVDPKAMSSQMGAKRALILYKLGRYDEAMKAVEQLSYQSGDPLVTTLHGMALARTGKYADALPKLKEPPKELENLALIDQAFCYWNTKQLPKALSLYTAAVEQVPQDAQPRRERALVEKDMGKMRPAISDLKAATDLDPEAGENFALLGQLHQQLGEEDLAIVNYRSAIALQYNPLKCYTEICRCQIKQKLYSDAESTIQKALAAGPNDEAAQKLAVQVRELLKTRAATNEAAPLEPITDINTADSKTLVKQGAAALKRGAAEQAVQYLKAAIDKGASDTHTRVMLAHAQMNAGEYKKAYQLFLSLEHTGSLDQTERFTFGRCAVAAGIKDDGIKIISRCVQERPNWMEARVELIKALVAANRRGEAQAVANQGMALASSEYEKTLYESAAKK